MDLQGAVELAVANVEEFGLNDIFPRNEELDFLRDEAFRRLVVRETIESFAAHDFPSLRIGPPGHAITPKGGGTGYDYRRSALIQPFDTVKYLSLVLLAADTIEERRIPRHEEIVLSYRFAPEERPDIYSKQFDVAYFQRKIRERTKRGDFGILVECDISNFYDRINIHRLESLLIDIGVDPWITTTINQLLLHLARKDSFGLPVGSNASRTLAEAALIEVDNHLIGHDVDYVRYVDDYRFFAPDAATAQLWLYLLIDRLAGEGLMLNGAKTSFTEIGEEREPAADRPQRDQAEVVPKYDSYGAVPRRFVRSSARSERVRTGGEDTQLRHQFESLKARELIDYEEFRLFTQHLEAAKEFDYLRELPELLKRCPPFIQYSISMLFETADDLTDDLCHDLSELFGEFLAEQFDKLLEWEQYQIVRLLSSKKFANKEALLEFFRSLPRTSGAFLGGYLIRRMGYLMSRGEAFELRNYFDRADKWEKRSILAVMSRKLPPDELGAWHRYVEEEIRGDPFARAYLLEEKRRRKERAKKWRRAKAASPKGTQAEAKPTALSKPARKAAPGKAAEAPRKAKAAPKRAAARKAKAAPKKAAARKAKTAPKKAAPRTSKSKASSESSD